MSLPALRIPKLILHIGMYKTGTTSIQEFLCAREAELAHAGVLYPKACRHMRRHADLGPPRGRRGGGRTRQIG